MEKPIVVSPDIGGVVRKSGSKIDEGYRYWRIIDKRRPKANSLSYAYYWRH